MMKTRQSNESARTSDKSLHRALRSLWLRVVLILIIFLAVPFIIYNKFAEAEAERQTILLAMVREQGLVIAQALEPSLAHADDISFVELAEELGRYSTSSVQLKLLFSPMSAPKEEQAFFYVAAVPTVSIENLDRERNQLIQQGILDRLRSSCAGRLPLAIRVELAEGADEVLSSITPVSTKNGCWALVVSHPTATIPGLRADEPYWRSSEVQLAAATYGGMAVLIIGIFVGIWRSLKNFEARAQQVRWSGGPHASFVEESSIPELAGVAKSFDEMVLRLRDAADGLRRAAEDNAHAFKTPLGIIRQAIEPLKVRMGSTDQRSQRAIESVELAVQRLEGLVVAARDLDEATADLLTPPRDTVNLSDLTRRLVEAYELSAHQKDLRLRADVEDNIIVTGSNELIETAIENVLDNGIGLTPERGEIIVTLRRTGRWATLSVLDSGPGVAPHRLTQIFDRYYSERPAGIGSPEATTSDGAQPQSHQGIGLWVVRRNMRALGGDVIAANRPEGGLCVRLTFPVTRTGRSQRRGST